MSIYYEYTLTCKEKLFYLYCICIYLTKFPFSMKNNNLYNLMTQLTQESRSLWRIKNEYTKDAKDKELKAFWKDLAEEKTLLVEDLKTIIKAEME